MIAVRKGSSETSSQFFLAGRGLSWALVGASLFATNIGAEHLVGLSGDAYRYGLCSGTVKLSTCLCLGVACVFLFPYYIRTKVFTIPEFLELRYNRAARVFFSGLVLLIYIMTKLAFHLYAGALVLHSLIGSTVMPMVILMGTIVAVIIATSDGCAEIGSLLVGRSVALWCVRTATARQIHSDLAESRAAL